MTLCPIILFIEYKLFEDRHCLCRVYFQRLHAGSPRFFEDVLHWPVGTKRVVPQQIFLSNSWKKDWHE